MGENFFWEIRGHLELTETVNDNTVKESRSNYLGLSFLGETFDLDSRKDQRRPRQRKGHRDTM